MEWEVVNLSAIRTKGSTYAEPTLFAKDEFVVAGTLESQSVLFALELLNDTGCEVLSIIDTKVANEVCDRLKIAPLPLSKPKLVRGYDGAIRDQLIIYMIAAPVFNLGAYREYMLPMLITDCNYSAILGKPWMNKHGVTLDMSDDTIKFPSGITVHGVKSHIPAPINDSIPRSQLLPKDKEPQKKPKPSPASPKLLKRPTAQPDPDFNILCVGAASYGTLARDRDTETFAMSVADIDRELAYDARCRMDALDINAVGTTQEETLR